MKTIFRTALEIAWNDGSMSKKGALMIEKLHDAMELEISIREEIEDKFFKEVLEDKSLIAERGEGKGDIELESWVNSIIDDLNSNELEDQILYLGQKGVENGLSKDKWLFGVSFTKEFNQSNTFAQGIWMEKVAEGQYDRFLKILEPLTQIFDSN